MVPIIEGKTVIDFPMDSELSEGMADAADANLSLPLALVSMALDAAFGPLDMDDPAWRGRSEASTRFAFERELGAVVARYMAGEFAGY